MPDWTRNGRTAVDSVPSRNPRFSGAKMTSANTQGLVTDIAGLRERAGSHLGYTDWQEMTQERVDTFADATADHQFIHVDVERSKQTPFGGTSAHGFRTLSRGTPGSQQLMRVTDAVMG